MQILVEQASRYAVSYSRIINQAAKRNLRLRCCFTSVLMWLDFARPLFVMCFLAKQTHENQNKITYIIFSLELFFSHWSNELYSEF